MTRSIHSSRIALSAAAFSLAAGAIPAFSQTAASGFYLGGFIGNMNVDGETRDDFNTYSVEGSHSNIGVLAGWRTNNGPYFYGFEGDIGFASGGEVSPNSDGCDDSTWAGYWCEQKGDAHVRAMFGYGIDKFNLFAAAGFAMTRVEYRRDIPGFEYDTARLTGSSIGLGGEYAVTDRVTLRLEGLRDTFREKSLMDGYNGKWSQNTVRAAAIFSFN